MPLWPPTIAAARRGRSRRIVRRRSSSSSSVALAAVVVAFLTSSSSSSSFSSSAALAPPMTSPRGGRPRTTTRRPPDRWRRDSHDHLMTTTPWSSPSSSSSTALRFFFDRFLNPYGISSGGGGDRTRDDADDDDDGELLDALLPRLPTRVDRSRMLEGFQRARLYEQLRLSKIKRSARERGGGGGDCDGGGGGGGDEGNDANDDDNPLDEDSRGPSGRDVDDDDDDDDNDDSSRMMGSFQRACHAGQLRLRETNGEGSRGGGGGTTTSRRRVGGEGGTRRGDDDDFFDKDEAFQRALLEERLRIRRLQRQTMEFERENSDVNTAPQLTTMVQENEIDEDVDNVHGLEKGSERYLAGIGIASSANDDGRGNSNMLSSRKLLVNRTEEGGPLMQLDAKLEKLRQMVTAATTPSSRAVSSAIASNNASSSMQSFLSKTHLPLPPREDASSLSLALGPVAHLLTSVFLLGAAGFYAAMAVVDVICNDDEAECSTRACLRGTSSVFRSCWDYIFPKGRGRNDGVDLSSAAWRTTRALQTSICASFYAVRCIFLRSSGHSKYAHESMDAVTGSLRYLVYAIRSVNVMLTRMMDIVRRSYEYIVQWSSICIHSLQTFYCSDHDEKLIAVGSSRALRHRLNPLRVISDIKIATLQRLREQSSLKNEEQRLRSDELYNKKLRLLNLDRVAIERDRQHLQEAWRQLEFEKRKMITEGVNILAWYVAAGKLAAKASNEVVEKRKDQNSQKNWNFWRRREDNTPSDR